jgi:hypothetical protein
LKNCQCRSSENTLFLVNQILTFFHLKVFFSPVEPKGTPFKPVNGPNGKDSRIGIVGAGAGGVHMAYHLKQKGFTNVTILEKSNRVGGKVDHMDLRGTRMTWHLWNSRHYNKTLVPLLDKFGFGPDIIQKSREILVWPTNDASVRSERAFPVLTSFPVFKTKMILEHDLDTGLI